MSLYKLNTGDEVFLWISESKFFNNVSIVQPDLYRIASSDEEYPGYVRAINKDGSLVFYIEPEESVDPNTGFIHHKIMPYHKAEIEEGWQFRSVKHGQRSWINKKVDKLLILNRVREKIDLLRLLPNSKLLILLKDIETIEKIIKQEG